MSLPALTFRARLILACTALVALTISLMIVPLFLNARNEAESVYRERLTAVAHGVRASLSADTVQKLATTGGMIPYFVTRNSLREFAWGQGDSLKANTDEGLFVAVRDSGRYRVIAHADWSVTRPSAGLEWIPPPSFADSLGNVKGSAYAPWWFAERDRMFAAAPVFSGGAPIAVVVATVPRSVATRAARASMFRSLWYALIALALAVGLAVVLTRQITRRVRLLASQATVLAGGNLQRDISDDGSDEFGELATALRDLTSHLRDLLSGIRSSSLAVGDAVSELTVGSDEMRAATTQVSAAAEAIAESAVVQTDGIRAISSLASSATAQAEEVRRYAQTADGTALHISNAARRVSEESHHALARMGKISAVTVLALPAVDELSAKSRRISSIAADVAEIADQANLLSLNAAIEAARAGVHGRGFGVVADEIRRLSDGTAQALVAINALAGEIEQVSRRTGAHMMDVQRSVVEGETAMNSSADALRDILLAVEAGRESTRTIAQHASAQYTRAGGVSAHLETIAEAASDNAGMAQQVRATVAAQGAAVAAVATSTEQLGLVAEQLRASLEGFSV